jgi:bidirectional [NiFe] hydrogenase diaphorase subunit
MVTLTVDGQQIECHEQQNLLAACLQQGVYIPNLCFLEEMTDPPASCRLCFVEIEGERNPVAACRMQPKNGMIVKTDTDRVRRLQRSALRLLLSVHNVDCKNCPSNKRCDLQHLSKFLKVRLKPKRLEHLDRKITIDLEHPLFQFVPDRCILCGKCIYICQKRSPFALLTFAKRGLDTVVTCFEGKYSGNISCKNCRACVEICPVSAIFLRNDIGQELLETSV